MGLFDFLVSKQDKEPYNGKTLDGQPLYNLTNKKSKYIEKSRFLFLGSYSKKDKETFNNLKKVIANMGYQDEVIYLKNNPEIIKFGVIDIPALVVDGKVVTYGKQLEIDDIIELFDRYSF